MKIKVGDYVEFKCDVEQGGYVTEVNGYRVVVENKYGFDGEYIGGETSTVVSADSIYAVNDTLVRD